MGWVVIATPWLLSAWERDPVPIVQEAEWAPGLVWTGAENIAPFQPIVSCYTDYAVQAHRLMSQPSLDLTTFVGNTLYACNHQFQVILQKVKTMEILLGSRSSHVKLCLDAVEGHVDVSQDVNRSDSLCTR
jgi:hypothetical protein